VTFKTFSRTLLFRSHSVLASAANLRSDRRVRRSGTGNSNVGHGGVGCIVPAEVGALLRVRRAYRKWTVTSGSARCVFALPRRA